MLTDDGRKSYSLPYSVITIIVFLTGLLDVSAEAHIERKYDRIMELSSHMTLSEIKQIADSIHIVPSGDNAEANLWYIAAISKPRDKFSEDDWNTLSTIYANYGTYRLYFKDDPITAFKLFNKSIDMAKKYCQTDKNLYSPYTGLAVIYANFDNPQKAISLLKYAFNRDKTPNDLHFRNYIFCNMAYVTWECECIDSVRNEIEYYLNLKDNKKHPMTAYNIQIAKAFKDFLQKNYDDAAKNVETGLKVLKSEYTNDDYYFLTQIMLSEILMYGRNYAEAKAVLDGAEQTFKRFDADFFCTISLYKAKEKYFKLTGQNNMVSIWHDRILRDTDSLYNSRNYTLIRDIEQENATSRLQSDLEISEAERILLKERSKTQTIIIIIISVSATIIILLLIWLLKKSRQLEECNASLFEKNISSLASDTDKTGRKTAKNVSDETAGEPSVEASGITPKDDETIKDNRIKSNFERIKLFAETDDEIYNSDFSIETMAKHVDLRVKEISRSINVMTGKNFNSFIAEYRVRKACRILIEANKKTRPTIDVLAEQVGYKSRTYFSGVFKTVTGMTTSEFLRQAQKKA